MNRFELLVRERGASIEYAGRYIGDSIESVAISIREVALKEKSE